MFQCVLSHRVYTQSLAQCCRAGLGLYLIQLLTGENPAHLDVWAKTLLDIFHLLLQVPPAASDVSATHAEVHQDHTKSQQPCLPGFSDHGCAPTSTQLTFLPLGLILFYFQTVVLTTTQSSFSLSFQEGVKTQTK